MINITRWSPDTCKCVIEKDTDTGNYIHLIEVCDAHLSLSPIITGYQVRKIVATFQEVRSLNPNGSISQKFNLLTNDVTYIDVQNPTDFFDYQDSHIFSGGILTNTRYHLIPVRPLDHVNAVGVQSLSENQTKNKAIHAIANAFPEYASLTDAGKIIPNLDKISYAYDMNRKLKIILKPITAGTLLAVQQTLDLLLGVGKVSLG